MTEPSERRAQLVPALLRPETLICVTSARFVTATGLAEYGAPEAPPSGAPAVIGVSAPSWPLELLPQHRTVLSERSAQT